MHLLALGIWKDLGKEHLSCGRKSLQMISLNEQRKSWWTLCHLDLLPNISLEELTFASVSKSVRRCSGSRGWAFLQGRSGSRREQLLLPVPVWGASRVFICRLLRGSRIWELLSRGIIPAAISVFKHDFFTHAIPYRNCWSLNKDRPHRHAGTGPPSATTCLIQRFQLDDWKPSTTNSQADHQVKISKTWWKFN